MQEPQWVLEEVVRAIHKQQLAEHGGSGGIRDEGILASALARPRNLFTYQPEQATLARLATSYAFSLSSNHPFVDGNKRVALVVSLLFLHLNGLELSAPLEDRYQVFMALAEGGLTEAELAVWFERNCTPTLG